MNHSTILIHTKKILKDKSQSVSKRLDKVCKLIKNQNQNYDWVGFYFAEQTTKTLHLGPFVGEPTEHKVIPFGKGICGQVADSNQTFVVKDVKAQDNYIACSLNVKSEIVVPLFLDDQNIGQIDIDSNQINAFSKEDDKLLSEINTLISACIKQNNIDLKSLWV